MNYSSHNNDNHNYINELGDELKKIDSKRRNNQQLSKEDFETLLIASLMEEEEHESRNK